MQTKLEPQSEPWFLRGIEEVTQVKSGGYLLIPCERENKPRHGNGHSAPDWRKHLILATTLEGAENGLKILQSERYGFNEIGIGADRKCAGDGCIGMSMICFFDWNGHKWVRRK